MPLSLGRLQLLVAIHSVRCGPGEDVCLPVLTCLQSTMAPYILWDLQVLFSPGEWGSFNTQSLIQGSNKFSLAHWGQFLAVFCCTYFCLFLRLGSRRIDRKQKQMRQTKGHPPPPPTEIFNWLGISSKSNWVWGPRTLHSVMRAGHTSSSAA